MSCQAFLSFRSSVDTDTSTFNAKAEGILLRTSHSHATTWLANDEAPLSAIQGKAELDELGVLLTRGASPLSMRMHPPGLMFLYEALQRSEDTIG